MFKRLVTVLSICTFLVGGFLSPVLAQTATPTPSSIIDQEVKRTEELLKSLSLKLPTVTDDPNQTVTFIPPNKKDDVSIQVDAQTFEKAKSPFVLPALAIGQHTLVFKFKNKQGVLQVLTQNVVVVPKSPEFAASLPTEGKADRTVTLSGTAIPNATVQVIQNSQHVLTTTTNSTGEWSLTSKELVSGKNNFIAVVIKNGFASGFSKTYNISAGSRAIVQTVTAPPATALSQAKQLFTQAQSWVNTHQQETLIGIVAVAACVVTVIFFRWFTRRKQASDEKTIAEILQNRLGTDNVPITERLKRQTESTATSQSDKKKVRPVKVKKAQPKKVAPTPPLPKAVKKKSGDTVVTPPTPAVVEEPAVAAALPSANPLEQADRLLDSTPEQPTPEQPTTSAKKLSREEFLKRFKKG